MTRRETQFDIDGDLIVINATIAGPRRRFVGWFVLDTGAAITTIEPALARELGYSEHDAIRRTKVHSALGVEKGYAVRVAGFSALHVQESNFDVNVFELGFEDFHGLLGMNFLGALNYDVRSLERRILVERAPR